MLKRLTTSSLAVVAGLVFAGPASAARPEQRPSAKIQAFGDGVAPAPAPDVTVAAPAPDPIPAPRHDVKLLLGAVIPPPPHVEVAAAGRRRPFDGRRSGEGGFVARPAAATRLAVNSPFGVRTDPITGLARMHTGVDLRAAYGESVGASMSGTVWFAGERAGYGNLVVVDHGSGIATFYAHLSRITVGVGQHVGAGELLGYVGSTGRSTGPHLHYEVRANGHPVDPSSQLALAGDELLVNGQSVGAAATGAVVLPKAPGGTSIAVDWSDADTIETATGQSLAVDWE